MRSPFLLRRRDALRRGMAAAASLAAPPMASRAGTNASISLGYSAVSDFATVFVGVDEGFFARRGLEMELRFIPLNPTIVPAVQSASLQIGGVTPTGFLQSVDAGLNHVVLAGGGVLSKTYTELGLVAKAGTNIRGASDCVGKRIGVPGLGALLHVTFRAWLKSLGVDAAKVSFVEAPFPQHADLLRGGAIDAVVTGGPFMARILESGVGHVAAYYMTFLPSGYPTVVHVARRDWVQQNQAAVKAFREGLGEAAAFMLRPSNEEKVRASLGKYLKLPEPVATKMQISPPGPIVTPAQLRWWGALMQDQGLLKGQIAYDNLILKA
ncbi:ABC transporter substrate-binding protein [Ideonella azotifigens]|uniref:Metal ABC transporter substrate-binding protein n=1 Tax=Ideonella azotifigens TaxID=513160 RepID=A0ABP3US72_9BURK|nr:ABC transporter substrate-binding protein [Ideonella azotifigens]MCD2341887.1 ABC transporter substrate-binding protein [Ideonella azotifigens]